MTLAQQHAAAFERLADQIEALSYQRRQEAEALRDCGVGQYGNVRVYWVGKQKVRAHVRREHLVVRLIK